jgi:uncharacterized coiled-coil DUF342 family protein
MSALEEVRDRIRRELRDLKEQIDNLRDRRQALIERRDALQAELEALDTYITSHP